MARSEWKIQPESLGQGDHPHTRRDGSAAEQDFGPGTDFEHHRDTFVPAPRRFQSAFGLVERAALQVRRHQRPPPTGSGRPPELFRDRQRGFQVMERCVARIDLQAQLADPAVGHGQDQRHTSALACLEHSPGRPQRVRSESPPRPRNPRRGPRAATALRRRRPTRGNGR